MDCDSNVNDQQQFDIIAQLIRNSINVSEGYDWDVAYPIPANT